METTKRQGIEQELEAIHPDSFGWALTCCAWDHDLAQDALQSAYLEVIEGRARFNGHSSLKTWFFGVVRNTVAEQRRGRLMRSVLGARQLHYEGAAYDTASADFRFAASVAAFGMLLRDSPHRGDLGWEQVEQLARDSSGPDKGGHRAAFLDLVRRAACLPPRQNVE